MKLGIEALHILSELPIRRIWNDACDEGVPYNDTNTQTIASAVKHLKGLEDTSYVPCKSHDTISAQRYWLPVEKEGGVTRGATVTLKLKSIAGNDGSNLINPDSYKNIAYYEVMVLPESRVV